MNQLGDDDKFSNPLKPQVSDFLQFVGALILYGYLIPISLYVSIEVVKVLQAMLINKDTEMYDEETGMSNERSKMKVTYLAFHAYKSSYMWNIHNIDN
jgi:magnesium-transporting ATPase (P-type)